MTCHKITKVLQIFLQVWSSWVAANFSPSDVRVRQQNNNCRSLPFIKNPKESASTDKTKLALILIDTSSIISGPAIRSKGFPSGSVVNESACNARTAGDTGLSPGWGRSPGEGHANPLQYSCLENPIENPIGVSPREGHRCLAGYSLWGHKESDMTELKRKYF